VLGVIGLVDKLAIIKLKLKGVSNREAASILGVDRKTVAKYWNEYKALENEIDNTEKNKILDIQEKICEKPKYNSGTRKSRKYSKAIDERLEEILEDEIEKTKELRTHKQKLTNLQIYEIIKESGFDIGYTTISTKIREKRNKSKECFIRQDYFLGDRLEYDFGEVKLVIDGYLKKYYLAVLSSPAADFRWAFLYNNQKKDVFMDSHVRFFEMVGGVYREVVYDNMRNVVKKFIGRNEKELNEDLIKLSLYYNFHINVTNCYSGNEKGHVEGSVKIIRNKVFAKTYKFKTEDEAKEYLFTELVDLNEKSQIKEEMKHLEKYKPKLDLAKVTEQKANKYSFVRVENNHYSVPDYLVGKKVTIKNYHDHLRIYSNNSFVYEHKKIDGENEISIDIMHYLKTLNRKPGAIKNSHALKSIPELKTIYDNYFTSKPRKFIEILQQNKSKSLDEIIIELKSYNKMQSDILIDSNGIDPNVIEMISKNQVAKYNQIIL
jgi:transposase